MSSQPTSTTTKQNYYFDIELPLILDSMKNRDPSRIIYNDCYGGIGFSSKFIDTFAERYGYTDIDRCFFDIGIAMRRDKRIIDLLEEMGSEQASAHYADLQIHELPLDFDDKYVHISEYDGKEEVSCYYIADETHVFIKAIEKGEVIDKNHPIYLSYLKHKTAYNNYLDKRQNTEC